MKNKHFYSALTLMAFLLLFLGSATESKLTTPLIVPDFDFSPPDFVGPGSAGIKIALIDPDYSGTFKYASRPPFNQFRQSMGKDFEEILTGRGYILKGPFETYDLLTYSDKTECELGLEVVIDLSIQQTSGGWKTGSSYGLGGSSYKYEATLNLSGKISISIIETFTHQKLLVKSVPVPQEEINVLSVSKFITGETEIPFTDPGVYNPIALSLSNFYKTSMKRGYDILAPEDLAQVQKLVPKIREQAGFLKR